MANNTIMLVCSAGMSTSMLVQKMQESAENRNLDYEIFAVAASEADKQLKKKDINAVLLGPQVEYMKTQFEEKGEKHNFPVSVIGMQDYGMFNGEKVLTDAEELMDNYSN